MALLDPTFEDERAAFAARTLGTTRDSYLRAAGRYPSIQETKLNGTMSGGYSDQTNKVYIQPGTGSMQSTMAHELSHASDNAQGIQQQNIEGRIAGGMATTPAQMQFLRARQQAATQVPRTLRALAPGYVQANAQYGATPEEARAFGVGVFYNPNDRRGPAANIIPPHVNATMATEQAIMEELAHRALGVRR
jgi:hypothetical protein